MLHTTSLVSVMLTKRSEILKATYSNTYEMPKLNPETESTLVVARGSKEGGMEI